jgi:hypothetical protein
MQFLKPDFRRDLIAQPEGHGSFKFFVVRDPESQRTLRFTFEGYQVARLLDGSRSLPQLVTEIKRRLGLQLTVDKLQRLITRLDALGCLRSTAPRSESSFDRSDTTIVFNPRRPTTEPDVALDSGIRAADEIAAREIDDDFEIGQHLVQQHAAGYSRAVVLAGFALVSAALWASWAVLQIV